ncbi:Pyruvate phosphate dikinase PEP/pyruvate-binding protein [uncultured Desulfobacterium sp.]|uniref:Pyruvate phosphate dikinase PEP/pyruvate-binding protein n=1 Tax=uncultured Desulfobacterium sp. TaxID=201089 RepID=A0A445N357_9BACT|nr:Pyruvate phosphate dikinase PEP/pyruvate-binding protein [uncultured Desulfobacterium sp.]
MASKALEVNIALSQVEVVVDKRYEVLNEVMGKFYGLRKGLQTFLEEMCHPYRNWEFIVQEARNFSLNYIHVLKSHPKGPDAARLYVDIFFETIESTVSDQVRVDATDNLLIFMQKIIKTSGTELNRFLWVIDYAFKRITEYADDIFFLFVKSFYQLNKIADSLLQAFSEDHDFGVVNRLIHKYYIHTYNYWINHTDPLEGFEAGSGVAVTDTALKEIFETISHKLLKKCLNQLEELFRSSDYSARNTLEKMIELPGFGQIVSIYSRVPQKIINAVPEERQANQWKLIFLLLIMNNKGLSSIHEEALRDINRTLAWLISKEDISVIKRFLDKTFAMLKESAGKYPGTALSCILNMGHGVYKTDEGDLVDMFIDSVVSIDFQFPEIKGVGDDWQIRVNPNHIQNIRVWLELIGLNPKWSKKLLSSLIINLSIGGVFIKDTDLFPRDITRLLNRDIGPAYNLVKQLARLFPTYFNDIGAEGNLRDISTEIDELGHRKDILIHFLRKQSHVESSNQIILLMEAVLNFWRIGSKAVVMPFVPPNIYNQIETEGSYIDGVHILISNLFDVKGWSAISDLLDVQEDEIKTLACNLHGVSDLDIKRVELAVHLYKLLYQKYHLGFTEMTSYLSQLQSSGLPELETLKKGLEEKVAKRRLKLLLGYLEKLERVILASEDYEIREDIYRKRHFTVDIPSMYGSYHEMKFDALGLTFRLESIINVLFEEIVESLNLVVITRATISEIHEYLRLFDWALRLDGINSSELARQLDVLAHALEIRSFSATQYLDIFRGFTQAVNNIVSDYFNNIHQENLLTIFNRISIEKLMPKYLPQDQSVDMERLVHRVTEVFLRERIASSLGLQQLDIFLSRIMTTLYRQLNELSEDMLQMLLSSDPQKAITPIYPPKSGVLNIIHLGNKGLNLVKMKTFGLPVPPGFIITTEVFRCRKIIEYYNPAKKRFKEQVSNEISALEKITGKSFGDPKNPLLLSVRSGSSISLPGMMETFLNVGINEDIVQGMINITGNKWFSWDTYRRFLQSYGMAFGLSRNNFDDIIAGFKKSFDIPYKRDFSGNQMYDVAQAYKELLFKNNIVLENSPLEQLFIAIDKVFDSWYSLKATTFRKILSISDDWGTAVTIQTMVFGNFSPTSGSGVIFTHNPRWSGDMVQLWGDFTTGDQGEDVVSGLVRTQPISKTQAEAENRPVETSLEVMFPQIYRVMKEWAMKIFYEKDMGPQEMEFTFEGPDRKDLYFLQTRDMVIRQRRKVYSFDFSDQQPAKLLDHGIGVSGGAMTGRVVFSLEEIRRWRKVEPETPLIMVRTDTVPDDIKEIYEADGLLTARGGSTSHAAIVAHRLGKTCVVGCSKLICNERDSFCSMEQNKLKSGDFLSINGLEGSVYLGKLKIRETEGM